MNPYTSNKALVKKEFSSNPFKRPFSEVNPGKKRPIDRKTLDPKFLDAPVVKEQTMDTGEFKEFTIEQSQSAVSQVSRMSRKDVELNYIMDAISKMDDGQRQSLVHLISNKQPIFDKPSQSIGMKQKLQGNKLMGHGFGGNQSQPTLPLAASFGQDQPF